MVAGGVLWCGKASYFKQPWNIFDFLIVILRYESHFVFASSMLLLF
jgi:hypothetical protein